MVEKSKANRFGLTPAWYGTASLVAACLAWGSVWLIFHQGPDGITKNRMFTTVTIQFLPWFSFVCGNTETRRTWRGLCPQPKSLCSSAPLW